jgi:hypothetical protein
LAIRKPVGMAAMKIMVPFSVAERSLVFIETTIFTILKYQTGPSSHPPSQLASNKYTLHREKNKRGTGKVLSFKILNVNSTQLNFIYNWKSTTNSAVPWMQVRHSFLRRGAFMVAFAIEKLKMTI